MQENIIGIEEININFGPKNKLNADNNELFEVKL
jgi:hypothetical protein